MTLTTDAEGNKGAHSNPVKGSEGPPKSTKKRGITADSVHGLHGLAELHSNNFSHTEVPQSCAVRAVFALASHAGGER
jgi:hypothetical protein